ncbi:MAG: UDP-N-acetylmuramate dehydrogenase [Lachnospiraceae bacterium]|nr:UDP-N-acetylmuramate dehydrogenase [Lachnospiraceae bacterium]
MDKDQIQEIQNIILSGTVLENEPMERHTTFRIGGPAELWVEPAADEIEPLTTHLTAQQIPFFVIGNGSNLLVSDEGIHGVVISIGSKMEEIKAEGEVITAEAGVLLSKLAGFAAKRGLAGLEFASGIPGSLGGAVVMNAGAYGGEMKDVITEVSVLTTDGIRTYASEEMEFSYRYSRVMEEGGIILSAKMRLAPGDESEILARMSELNERRREKQPLNYPSAGSTFKRPEGYFAGKLIQDAGLLGYRVGDACVSEKHGGFVVNCGHATATNVYNVIRDVQAKVQETFGVTLEPEVRLMGRF